MNLAIGGTLKTAFTFKRNPEIFKDMTVGEYLIYVVDYSTYLMKNLNLSDIDMEDVKSFIDGNKFNKSGVVAFTEFVESNPVNFKLANVSGRVDLRTGKYIHSTVSFDSAMADFYAVNRAPQELIDLCDSFLHKHDNKEEAGYTEAFYKEAKELSSNKEEFDFDRSCL